MRMLRALSYVFLMLIIIMGVYITFLHCTKTIPEDIGPISAWKAYFPLYISYLTIVIWWVCLRVVILLLSKKGATL